MNDDQERSRSDIAARFLRTIQEESKTWELEGKDAWTALSRLGGRRLPPEDAVVMARRLHSEIPRLKAALRTKGVRLGDFCRGAGLEKNGQYSKELHRLTLAPGKSPEKVGLRRTAAKYRMLMAEMADVMNESRSSLANRIMVGTSLHPANASIRDEVEQVQFTLQTIVDKVDTEFNLFQGYKETAELKAQHAEQGGQCRWPQYEAEYRVSKFDWYIRQDVISISDEKSTEVEQNALAANAAEREAAMDKSRAFWEVSVSRRTKTYDDWIWKQSPSGCLQGDEFFYVPHAYLGFGGGCWEAIDSSLAQSEQDTATSRQKEEALHYFKEYGSVPTDEWDDLKQEPQGQTSSLGQWMGQWHAWIVAYPSPDNTRLMPMIYVPGEEGGAILIPLDAATLLGLRQQYWFGPNGEVLCFFDRIKQLIGYRLGERQLILEGLRRTAPWLAKNPFIKMRDARKDDQALMQEFYRALLSDLVRHDDSNKAGQQ